MIAETQSLTDDAKIRRLIGDQGAAFAAKDLDDIKPPFQLTGIQAYREMWETCGPYMPASSGTETRDLAIFVGGDFASAQHLFRFTDVQHDHPGTQSWFRVSATYRRQGDGWEIVREHISVPFDPMTGQAVFSGTLD